VEWLQQNIWTLASPAAIASGYWFSIRRGRQAGLDLKQLDHALILALVVGLLTSHAVEVLFYKPHELDTKGIWALLRFWEGLSSYGGFMGGGAAVIVYYLLKKRKNFWQDSDVILQGIVVGWIFGRLGCTFAGDHPGTVTDVAWAYHYPGGARHNLGFYEFMFTLLLLFPANLLLYSRKPRWGSFLAMNFIFYGTARFVLDFFRASDLPSADPRYAGLTLAQYFSMALFLGGVLVWAWIRAGKTQPLEVQS
jgi:phosphatidylglycerol:prolipoprotein diacylglycerol transferase